MKTSTLTKFLFLVIAGLLLAANVQCDDEETTDGDGEEETNVAVICSALPSPHLLWAQRKDKVWITVVLENCKNPTHELKEKTFFFRGKGGTENLDHEVTLELFAEIDTEKSTVTCTDRQALFVLIKKDQDASYWPRLTKAQKKLHFLKTDFNRWRDEDDTDDDAGQDEEKQDFNMDAMMNSMGGLGGANFGGPEGMMNAMGGMGGMGGLGGANFGGPEGMMNAMGGMGGLGGANFGGGPEGEQDSDDEDLPDLQ